MDESHFDQARFSLMWELCSQMREELRSEDVSKKRVKQIIMQMLRLLDGDRVLRMDKIVDISHSDVMHRVWQAMKKNSGIMDEIKSMDDVENVYFDRFL